VLPASAWQTDLMVTEVSHLMVMHVAQLLKSMVPTPA
jgi:hypothetical protein